jgi:superfamily II DNA or RNA helicase
LTGNLHSLNIITSKAKIKGVIQIIEDIIEQGRKAVVFGSYREPLNELEAYFKEKCVKIDGSVDSWTRDQHIQRFHNDPECEVFIGNMKAAGVGINLTNASDVVFINFPFTPAELYQAIDRCNRIGQKNTVNVHYTFCDDSIDEYIYDIIVDKEKDINTLIDQGKEVVLRENTTEILIKKLLKRDDVIIDIPCIELQGEEEASTRASNDLQPEIDRCANYELGNEATVLPEFPKNQITEAEELAVKIMMNNGSQFIGKKFDIKPMSEIVKENMEHVIKNAERVKTEYSAKKLDSFELPNFD